MSLIFERNGKEGLSEDNTDLRLIIIMPITSSITVCKFAREFPK